jgi:hypothetical protein
MERKMRRPFRSTVLATLLAASWWQPAPAQSTVPDLEKEIRQRAAQIENTLIGWRRDIHEHPELGEQEMRTAGLVADHLRKLGLEVKTGVAQTGVIAVLRGGKPGPVVALRRLGTSALCQERTQDRSARRRCGSGLRTKMT